MCKVHGFALRRSANDPVCKLGGGGGLKQMVIINLFISCLDFLIIEFHGFCFVDNIKI